MIDNMLLLISSLPPAGIEGPSALGFWDQLVHPRSALSMHEESARPRKKVRRNGRLRQWTELVTVTRQIPKAVYTLGS
jgi:hypothetical protein